jgi:myo-inositol-1-phosphate synthase
MSRRRIGLWLVGAFGGVGTTITLGLSALKRGMISTNGLVTGLPLFDGLPLPHAADFIIGGHDIRETSFEESAEEFRRNSGVYDHAMIAACREDLEAASDRVRPGTKLGAGSSIDKMGTWSKVQTAATAKEAIDRIAADMAAFVQAEKIDHLIVLSVASTEPPFPTGPVHAHWDTLNAALVQSGPPVLPASSLYAIAALQSGHTYLNFTPSLGASIPALYELAESTKALHGGKDGKTGETLMKTVLAPMFAFRNLEVMSWVGHNIFGNRDGVILDDPINKSSKVDTKDRVVHQILGYKPKTLVTIEYIPDMGDWKTAWDHIHFKGFLNTPMTLQFTWQGCDSLLAAPLAIDLIRLADLEKQRGSHGLMRHLASFFKGPEGVEENDFFKQFAMLVEYVEKARGEV